MKWIRTIVGEIYGLFVDDGWLALSILLWTAVLWLARVALPHRWAAVLFAAGLLAILAESALRAAGKARR